MFYLFSSSSYSHSFSVAAIATDIDGNGIEMLFDVMTHTLDMYVGRLCPCCSDLIYCFGRASGVGDHGKPGLKMFLEKHECGNRCTHLRLSQDGFACNSEPAGEDSEED
jgi:hypothetical protein